MFHTLFLAKRSRLQWPSLTLVFLVLIAASKHSLAETLTLESAWALAEQNNPEIRRTMAGREAVQGEIKDASALLFNNPTLNVEAGRRRLYQPDAADPQRSEWSGGISQTLELAGQQGFRRQTADAKFSALQQEINETRRRVIAEVEQRFIQVLALQKRIEIERRTLELIERNTSLVSKRVDAGEDSKLDGNLAIVDAERAHNQVSVLQEQLTRARAALAAVLQLPAQALPTALGELQPAATSYSLEDLLASVVNRPALQALSLREQSARSSLDFERAARYPDLTVSLNNSREAVIGGQDNVTSIGLSLPIPLFRQNATGVGRATSEVTQAEIDRNTVSRDARAAVIASWQRRQSLHDRVQRLNTAVYPKLEENLRLSQVAYQEGEIALPQLLLVQRQVIDAQRDLIEAQLDLRLTQIELEYAAGWPPVAFSANKE